MSFSPQLLSDAVYVLRPSVLVASPLASQTHPIAEFFERGLRQIWGKCWLSCRCGGSRIGIERSPSPRSNASVGPKSRLPIPTPKQAAHQASRGRCPSGILIRGDSKAVAVSYPSALRWELPTPLADKQDLLLVINRPRPEACEKALSKQRLAVHRSDTCGDVLHRSIT
jgi:hypothetical protein